MVLVTAAASIHRVSENAKRTPLGPPDSANGLPERRRPRGREVTSRYLSSSSVSSNSSASTSTTSSSSTSVTSASSAPSRRFQSPMMLGNKTAAANPKSQQRAVSAERPRTPAATTPSGAERMLVASVRSLSVSFQGESYSVPLSKVKPPPTAVGTPGGSRKGTPERRKTAVTPAERDRKERDRENSRPSNQQQQHRWPGSLRRENSNFLTRSLDYGTVRVQPVGSNSALKELRKSADENNRLKLNLANDDTKGAGKSGDSINSDVESVSLESTAGGTVKGRSRGVTVPPRFWQDSSNRAHKLQYPADSPSPNSASSRTAGQSKFIAAKKFQNSSPVSSPMAVSASRGLSPHRGVVRPASPSKALNSSTGVTRGASPSRARGGLLIPMNESNTCGTPSLFQFAVDARTKGKLGENRIAEVHDLRLLHNQLLQWRYVNAKTEHTLLVQKHTAERSLYNAWVKNTKLQHMVGSKKIELQLLRLNLKVSNMLKEQIPHLECWGMFDRDHCNSVSAAAEALKASTVRLPTVGCAKADVHGVQEAISSAVDVMQAMASSICSLLSKVEQMNLLVSELSNTSAQGHRLLDECKDFLSIKFIPSQVTHCSLRTHILQAKQQVMPPGKTP